MGKILSHEKILCGFKKGEQDKKCSYSNRDRRGLDLARIACLKNVADQPEALRRSVAAILVGLRKSKGFSQTDLASRSGVGRSYISHLENATRMPTIDTLIKLAGAFDLKPGELLEEIYCVYIAR